MKTVIYLMAVLAGIYILLYSLFDNLPTYKTAAIVLGGIVMAGAGVLLAMWLAARMWQIRQSTPSHYEQIGEQQAYRISAAPALPPAPRRVNVPLVTYAGESEAARSIELASSVEDQNHERIEITCDVEALRRVASVAPDLPTRARTGVTSSQHSAALAFLRAHSWITSPSVKGQPAQWRNGATGEVILKWIDSISGEVQP